MAGFPGVLRMMLHRRRFRGDRVSAVDTATSVALQGGSD
jgi:hypothetical protein